MIIIPQELEAKYESMWQASKVDYYYLGRVKHQIDELIRNLNYYDPSWNKFSIGEFEESIEMLAYTTTEILAQLCAGGMNWTLTDKARFLSPTVDFESIVTKRLSATGKLENFPRRFFKAMQLGSWDFLKVAEHTRTWFEAINFSKDEIRYLLWSAYKALGLIEAEERVSGFTFLALNNDMVLDVFCKCELPIQSVLCMQFTIDGLLPPNLQAQWETPENKFDFAIPDQKIGVVCGEKNYVHEGKEFFLTEDGWTVLQFSSENILRYPANCSNRLHSFYPWTQYISSSELKTHRILQLFGLTDDSDWLINEEVGHEKFRELVEVLNLHNHLIDFRNNIKNELNKKTIQMKGHAITLEFDRHNKNALAKYNQICEDVVRLEKRLDIVDEYLKD